MKKRTLQTCLSAITAEPALLLYVIAMDLESVTSNALWYTKVCISLYDDEWICEHLSTNDTLKEQEEAVQKETSEWLFYNNFVSGLLGLVSVFVYGQLSDRVGRKIAILTPFVGALLNVLILLLGAAYIQSPLGFLLVGSFLSGASGGYTSLLMATTSYISSIAGPEKKTSRISLLYGCGSFASLVAYTFSGVLLDATSFVFVFSVCFVLFIIGILYVVFILKDIKTSAKNNNHADDKNDLEEPEEKSNNFLQDLWINVKDVLSVALQPRKYNDRVHIFVLMGIIVGDVLGSATSVTYLYLRHPPLSFSQSMYGFYSGSIFLARTICLFAIVPALKHLKTSDTVILLLALVSYSAQLLILGFSTETWMPFVATWVGILYGSTFVTIRGMLSTMVRIDELGKVFALMAAVENLAMILNSAFYNYFLYPLTLDIFAGFCYIFGAVFLVVPMSMTGWLHFDLKKYPGRYKNLNGDLTELQGDFDDMMGITTINAMSAGNESSTFDHSENESKNADKY